MITWKEHKEYMKKSWNEFYTYWKNAPAWQWLAQVLMLAMFAFLLLFFTDQFIQWAETAEMTPFNDALGTVMLFGIPIALIICMRCFALMIALIARILDLPDR